jgi:hypothetical protein
MRAFRQLFNDYKLTISGMSSLAEDSFKFWAKNIINKGVSFNPSNFLTGKIYSFAYQDSLDKKKKFINNRPVVFFTGFVDKNDKLLFQGIDMILIPPPIRLAFLERITKVYNSQIDSNIKKILESDGKDQMQLRTEFETLDILLQNIPYKNAYRYWDVRRVKDIKEISYEDWTKIVYLHTKSTEGTPIEEIYKKNIQ